MKIKYNKKPQVYKVEEETIKDIAFKFDTEEILIKQLNKIDKVKKGDFILLPTSNFYVVKPLDTFESVAKKLGVDKYFLMEKNQVKTLFIGQILFY